MPRMNGFEVCRKIQQVSSTPVIMLTAAGDEEHIVQGFRYGADDYVVKPFSPKQLALRIRAVMRRTSGQSVSETERTLKVGEFRLDVEAHQVTKGDLVVQLTPLEFRIFQILAMNEGRVVSFARLVEYGWGYNGGEPAMLKTHISHLRKKLTLEIGKPGCIQVLHGVGYMLAAT